MRGMPGCGKSTLAKAIAGATGGTICSADDHYVVDGKYVYDFSLIGIVHMRCMRDFDRAIAAGTPVVIVDNTNLRRKDFAYYRRQAKRNGYEVQEILVGRPTYEPHQEICAARNTHGISLDIIKSMSTNFRL